MAVFFQTQQEHIILHGKTYPYRELIRTLGGQYQASAKTWIVPLTPENLAQVHELCRSVGGGPHKTSNEPSKRRNSGEPEATQEFSSSIAPLGDGYSIRDLMQKVQLLLTEGFPRSIRVLGEIQNFRAHASGNYLQLADIKEGGSQSATLTVNATLWRSQAQELERKYGRSALLDILQDGMRVRLLVDVSLYRDRGQLSLQIQDIDPNFTKGSLALAREALLREMRSRGLDRKNKALKLPSFPLHVGLISAPDSRAQSDFIDQLRVYGYSGTISFFHAQMQGEKTLTDVLAGLDRLTKAQCDLIVLTRGGGSAADLRWFDSPDIAYAIADCPVPVIAAIGHHDDVCVAEEISFQREKTPTAAADYIISLLAKTRANIESVRQQLSQAMLLRAQEQELRLQAYRSRLLLVSQQYIQRSTQRRLQLAGDLALTTQRILMRHQSEREHWLTQVDQVAKACLRNAQSRLNHKEQQLFNQSMQRVGRHRLRNFSLLRDLQSIIRDQLFQQQKKIMQWEQALIQYDPKPWLDKGWTQLTNFDGRRIESVAAIQEGERLRARFADGSIEMEVKKRHLRKENKE